jgi:hypothetical protein
MAKPTVSRTLAGRMKTFDRAVTLLRTESGGNFTWTMQIGGQDSSQRPPRESFRSFLMAVRNFDSRGEDIYIGTILDDIESFALLDATRWWVNVQRQLWEEAKERLLMDVKVNSELVTPRTCFEMLVYTEDMHFDADREAYQQAVGPLVWEFVIMHGSLYASSVSGIAIVLRALARDDPATAYLFVPRQEGKESAVEWLPAHNE